MSYILDALKKSEHEREQAEREQQGAAKAALAYETTEPKKNKNYGVLVVLILIVNIALGVYIFLKDDTPETAPVAKVDTQESTKLPKPKPILKNDVKKVKSSTKDVAKVAKVVPKTNLEKSRSNKILRSDSNKRLAEKERVEKTVAPKPVAKVNPVNAKKSVVEQPRQIASIDTKKQVQQAKNSGKMRLPPEIDPTPVKKKRKVATPKGLTRTRVGVEQTNTRVKKSVVKDQKTESKPKSKPKVVFSKVELTADPNDIPTQVSTTPVTTQNKSKPRVRSAVPNFMDMDPDFRRTFPKIDINVHVYDSNPNDRFTLIEMKRYGEGDTLSGGIKIKEIAPEGLVIVYKGKTFLYPAK